ncbi:hypothetical protein K4K58_009813 [Colletotrichum sp. SAR11_239]|nr:hypothetical protein K4K58_009813 [Colletotrichum sp. SAR11_239]
MAPWPSALEITDASQPPAAAASEIISARRSPAWDRVPDGLTDHQWTIIQSTSLAVAALSFASVTLAFYWFSRMRRSFRHDLIMLLMSSDMLKSLWFIIFPIADFRNGPIPSSSSFCQASGFFLSVGIEASDIAVVLIALHTAIYIFRPRYSGRQSGLYPHRRIAFAVFILLPLLMASLAFINSPGYANNGEYCYLPVRPEWTRLALSWVPRYMILLTIVALYAYIYTYVTLRIRRFGRLSAMRRANIELIHSRQKIQWNWPTYGNEDGRIPEQDESVEHPSFDPSTSPLSATFEPITPPPQSYIRRDTIDLSPSYNYHPHRHSFSTYGHPPHSPTTARAKSLANIWSILRRGTTLDSDADHNATPFLFHPAMDGTGMAKTRDKIRRQLRLLFVYPLVYILIWAVPFVAHVMRWDNPEQAGPFAVVLLSLVSLSIQGLVNACLFCAVEKPWIDRRAKYRRTPSKLRRDKDEARQRVGRRTSSLA